MKSLLEMYTSPELSLVEFIAEAQCCKDAASCVKSSKAKKDKNVKKLLNKKESDN